MSEVLLYLLLNNATKGFSFSLSLSLSLSLSFALSFSLDSLGVFHGDRVDMSEGFNLALSQHSLERGMRESRRVQRESERGRKRERERARESEKERERARERARESEREKARERARERERERKTCSDTNMAAMHAYRGTSLTRNSTPLRAYSRTM